MRRSILLSGVVAVGVAVASPAISREIRDPEAKFKIKVPDTWSAVSQSSRDGASLFWAFLSPDEHFRIILRTEKLRGKFECDKRLSAFEASELKNRMPGFVRLPVSDEDAKAKAKSPDECGGSYAGLRKDGKNNPRAYIVFANFERKGGIVYRWLGEAEKETFEKQTDEFLAMWESIVYLD
ncbi:MAG: hypothetical protein HYY84_14825 [Deltaproteobacteria bacterium]|nr:hypothetical protein [Deltaproteobacteria bacterium]